MSCTGYIPGRSGSEVGVSLLPSGCHSKAEALSQTQRVENTEASIALAPAHSLAGDSTQGDQRLLLQPSFRHIKQGCHSKEWTAVPTSSSGAVDHRFGPGKRQFIKRSSPERKWLYLKHSAEI